MIELLNQCKTDIAAKDQELKRAYTADEFEKVETETPAAIPDWLEETAIRTNIQR